MSGFNKMMINNKTINWNHISLTTPNEMVIPKEAKNIRAKKSLNDLTLPMISKLYSKLPKVTPAMKAPIAIDIPK